MWQKTCHELRLIKASSVTNSPSVDWAAMRLNEHLPPYTGEAFTPTALITLSAQFTYKFLVYHYVLSLRIQVNQSLSRFSLSEWCDVEFHSDSTWSFSLPSWAVILLHKTAKLHVNNAERCSKAPKETLSSLRIQVNQTFSHFFFVRESCAANTASIVQKVNKKKRRFSGCCPAPVMFGA